jgi:two-component system chemotaxis response regulator CheY
MAYSVLIVDDSPAMRRMIRRVVDMSGVDVGKCVEAGNGCEALAVLRSEEWIDIVLTDINMPEMNGEEFVIELRKDAALSTVPVLVVSTDQSESRIERMMAQGANGYLPKPFMPGDLCSEIQRLLGGPSDAGF